MGSLPHPGSTSKFPENSPRTASLSRAPCNPLMTLSGSSPRCAGSHSFCVHTPLRQLATPVGRGDPEAQRGQACKFNRSLNPSSRCRSGVSSTCATCPKGQDCVLSILVFPISSTNIAIARTQYLFVERVDNFAVPVLDAKFD